MDRWIGAARVRAKATRQGLCTLPVISALTAALAFVLPGAAFSDGLPSTAHVPFGLYAHVDIEDVLPELVKKAQITQTTTQACAVVTASSSDQAALHATLQNFYTTLLSDRAISGITAGIHWCRVQIENPARQLSSRSHCAALLSGRQRLELGGRYFYRRS